MKKLSFSKIITVVAIVLFAASVGSRITLPTAYADSDYPEWQITVTGLVDHSLNLSLTELAAMPQVTVYAPLICVGTPSSPLEEGDWTGVSLRFLLETAGISPDAVKVAFHASDGFTTDLTIEDAMREDIILAYEKDGVPLDEIVRLVAPGKWGYKWIYEITVIELVDYDFLGYWENFGYSDAADIEEVPEFTTAFALIAPMVLVSLIMIVLKKRGKQLHI